MKSLLWLIAAAVIYVGLVALAWRVSYDSGYDEAKKRYCFPTTSSTTYDSRTNVQTDPEVTCWENK